jgi:hypothetical protein
MRASTIMLMAVGLYVVHRWATPGKTALDGKTLVEGVFAILVIAMLDQGQTEEIAKGFAWLFFVVAAYAAIPSITKATQAKKTPAPRKGVQVV